MRGGAAGSCDGNMRQRGQIMQRKTFCVEVRAQLSVGDAGGDSHRSRLRIEGDHFVHLFQREEIIRAVGNLVEAVASAQDLQLVLLLYKFLNLIYGSDGI